jgi:hypothetical protein
MPPDYHKASEIFTAATIGINSEAVARNSAGLETEHIGDLDRAQAA